MKEKLKRLGISQKKLAETLGTSPETVCRWCKNRPPKAVDLLLDAWIKLESDEVAELKKLIAVSTKVIKDLLER